MQIGDIYKKKSAIYNILKLGNANLFKFEYYLKIWNIPNKLYILAYEISLNVRSVSLNGHSVTLNVHSVTRNGNLIRIKETINLIKKTNKWQNTNYKKCRTSMG